MVDEPAAVAEDDRDRGGRQQVDDREVDPVQDHGLVVGRAVAVVHAVERLLLYGLPRERLHDAHAGDVLGERGGDEAEPLADIAVGAIGAAAEPGGRDRHQRQHRQRRERELDVEEEENDAVPRSRSVFWIRLVTPSVTSWSSASTSFVIRLMITPARLRS